MKSLSALIWMFSYFDPLGYGAYAQDTKQQSIH